MMLFVACCLLTGASGLASPSRPQSSRPPPSALTNEEVERYSRHLILEDVGLKGQSRLKDGRVLCVGAGGLGSPALLYLAAAGVGHLTVIDDDVVDVSNLQRQIIHDTDSVGSPKALSAKKSIGRVNPLVEVTAIQERLTRENAHALISSHDVVLDGSDNFETKYLIDDVCIEAGVPSVYGAILRFEGHCSVFNYPVGVGATLRDFLPTPPSQNAVPSCAEGGVVGVLPGVIGCLQATEVVKLLVGTCSEDELLASRLLIYDAMSMRFRELALERSPDREAMSSSSSSSLKEADDVGNNDQVEESFGRIDAADAMQRLKSGWNPYVLDVRLPQEAEICSLPFADALCPHRAVADVAGELPKDRDILVHCKSGFRSRLACETLAELGFERLYSLNGGILAWAEKCDPRIPKY